MGCSASTLDDDEAVQLCKDRRNFIKQAVEHRMRFASGHMAYIESLRRVSLALRTYVDGDEARHDFLDSYTTPPFTPVKRLSPEIIGVHLKSFTPPTTEPSENGTSRVVNYLRSGGEPAVTFEEIPGSPETVRIESYYPMDGIDGFFTMQASPMQSSFYSSPYSRPNLPPASPQTSQWDFFWNPFSSLDAYGYHPRDSFDQVTNDDEIARLRQVREEEGIPELEEEDDDDDEDDDEVVVLKSVEIKDVISKVDTKSSRVAASEAPAEVNRETEKVHSVKEVQSQGMESIEVSEAQNAVDVKVTNEGEVVANREGREETPGFTVYVNRRPTSMAEVMKDVNYQFIKICDTAHEVSVMLEVSRAQHSSTSSELAAIRMLNPIALFRSGSSRSSSSRFLQASSSSRDEGYESSSDYSEESCMISGSHQSTLDRLYAWEKKLYEEVKSGERTRIAYEKKCTQLRNHDVNGEEPSVVDRTRAAVRDLRTRLQISIHSVEYVSKRIETLRDEELHPQLMELIHGLARMWRTMADCHRIQKGTIDEAKLLLFSPSADAPKSSEAAPTKSFRYATNLEAELRNWRSCLETWIDAQRSYARALSGWTVRCARPQRDGGGRAARSPLSPGRSCGGDGAGGGASPVYGICVQWSRLLDSVSEARAVEGVDFFAAGIGSVCAQQREGAAAAAAAVEGAMTAEKVAEVASRVLCAGLSVSVGYLAEFAVSSAEGYEALMKRWGKGDSGAKGLIHDSFCEEIFVWDRRRRRE